MMSTLRRGAFVAVAAVGLTVGGSTIAAADTGAANSGSAGYINIPCAIKSLLKYGTISAGAEGMYGIPECSLF